MPPLPLPDARVLPHPRDPSLVEAAPPRLYSLYLDDRADLWTPEPR